MSALSPLLKEIASGKARPVYLVVGEEFLARKAATELVDALVPKGMQGLNLTVMDAPSPAEVARDLATVPMFRGSKVVWAREPEFLLPRKGRTDALSKAREAWVAGRRKDAARRVLGIAARAGWTAAQLDPAHPQVIGREAWKDELDIELAEADLAFLGEVSRFCAEEGIRAPETDGGALEALLAQGIPTGHHLVIEASQADGRLGIYKALGKAGALLEVEVAGKNLKDVDLGEPIADALRPFGKTMHPTARDRLRELVGRDMRTLASEVQKLALYVGERRAIGPDDVNLLVQRSREDEEFELRNLIQNRKLAAALAFVDDALDRKEPPLALLGAIAGALRGLLADKDRYAAMDLPPRLEQPRFVALAMGQLTEEAKARGARPPNPWAAFFGWKNQAGFTRKELIDLLLAAGDCDVELKSSAVPRVALQRLVLRLRPS